MYVGFVISLAALALLGGALSSLLFVIGFFVVTGRWYNPFEENALNEKLGQEYRDGSTVKERDVGFDFVKPYSIFRMS